MSAGGKLGAGRYTMAKSTGGMPLSLTGYEQEALPIAVATLVIDGKRLTPAFYKQITEADLIAEDTGELRGIPLGYFHLHSKSCPEFPHTHVLWGAEAELHLATVVSLEKDERYQQQKQASLGRQEHLIHLLSLLLGLANSSYTMEWVSEKERKLAIAGYTLYVDKPIADRLQRLQQAQEQWMKGEAAWQALQESKESSDLAKASQDQRRVEAEAILAQFDQQGIELKHPARDQIEGEGLRVYGYYSGNEEYAPLDGPKTWCRYPVPSESDSRKEPLLYWRAKDRQQRHQQKERLGTAVETLLTPRHAMWLLRLLLIERMAHEQIRITRESVGKLAENPDIATLLQQKISSAKTRKKEASSLSTENLNPDQVWDCYERESKRFKAFTQRWKTSLEQLARVQQLFLLS